MSRLEGKVAFVTGAGRGQGRSHAVRLAEEGADVVVVDICAPIESVPYPLATADDLAETAAEVKARGQRVVAAPADVRRLDDLVRVLDDGVRQLGGLDIVCANAGIYSQGHLVDLSEQTWQDMIDVNLTGVWHTCKAAIPHLVARGGGSIVITSSVMGLQAAQNTGHYVTAKHGLVGLARTMALEHAADRIRVNTVHPTAVDTLLIQNEALYRSLVPDAAQPNRNDVAPVMAAMNAFDVPWIEPGDVSDAVVFLASDESRFMTGVALPVDAGYLIK